MNNAATYSLRNLVALLSIVVLLTACGGSSNLPAQGGTSLGAAHRTSGHGTTSSGYQQLYAFKGTPDGASPLSGLIASGSLLYGTTVRGSSNYCSSSCGSNNCYEGCGTVFSVGESGSESVVYNFKGNFNSGQDGSWPFSGLTELNGQLYGTASSAGLGHGIVYTVSTSGSESVLYKFAGGSSNDGSGPEGPLTAFNNTLYGGTVFGGGTGCGGAGCGTVYSLSTAGKETVLYSFKGGTDGERVYAGVTRLHGKFYGATLFGGGGCASNGCGTIFEVNAKGKERVLYRFGSSSTGGEYPNGLIAVKGVLYGTTEGGGSKSSGTFFSITPSGTFHTIYNFTDIPDGNLPGANVIYSKGSFYGTTVGGGTTGAGTVFKINSAGTEQVLYSFQSGSDGSAPQGPVYLYHHELYGTTYTGGGTGCGGSGCGTIFKVRP